MKTMVVNRNFSSLTKQMFMPHKEHVCSFWLRIMICVYCTFN